MTAIRRVSLEILMKFKFVVMTAEQAVFGNGGQRSVAKHHGACMGVRYAVQHGAVKF
jgi:hypothetical protein